MASATVQGAGQKRKASTLQTSSSRKRQKAQDARAIPVQSADAALSTSGELNIAAFIKARESEIGALDKSMQKSKKGLMTRAFQQVPRDMRRRTASHNVKKVPRRLRRRAEREMKEDNTPTVTARRRTPSRRLRLRLESAKAAQTFIKKSRTVRQRKKEAKADIKRSGPDDHGSISRVPRIKKNKLLEPPKATSKFKRLQVNKTWLPTHLWHAKRAHMTKPTEPLWRMAIPLKPTEKSYRPTHRAGGSRGCIAWDTSYISTIGCKGTEASLDGLLKSIGFYGEGWQGIKYKRWKSGSRSAHGWLFERDQGKAAIAPATVIWCAESVTSTDKSVPNRIAEPKHQKVANRQLFIRVHPSAFHQLWLEVIKVAKTQKPQVLLEDLRFEIGSVEIIGPGSTEALLGILKPTDKEREKTQPVHVWDSLAGLTNPACLPVNAVLSFDVPDPRLKQTHAQVMPPKEEAMFTSLNEFIVSWPPDKVSATSGLFSHKQRHLAATSIPSQKAVTRYKAKAKANHDLPHQDNGPQIPVLLIATRSQQKASNAQGTWTLMLPWKCLDVVWRSLMHYNLTSGVTPRFGGLDQIQQIHFENGQPWYPADAAGTQAGQAWERTQSEQRFDEWLRRPASRRIAWDSVDLGNGKRGEHGNGWACDWDYLLVQGAETTASRKTASSGPNSSNRVISTQGLGQRILTQRQRKAAKAEANRQAEEINARRRNTSSAESEGEDQSQIESELVASVKMCHVPFFLVAPMLSGSSGTNTPEIPALTTIHITLLARGTPSAAARIYRLPSISDNASADLRKLWLNLDHETRSENTNQGHKARKEKLPFKKDKLNRHGLPRMRTVLPKDSLSHVQYLPPDAHPDVIAQYGPQANATSSSPTAEEREEQLQQLMFPNMTPEERLSHPACPGAHDLIGFVTTGSYNLAEGRGVAIASIWIQRLLEGWKHDLAGTEDRRTGKQRERERHLCIVRNAGESVGRLAVWELCRD